MNLQKTRSYKEQTCHVSRKLKALTAWLIWLIGLL